MPYPIINPMDWNTVQPEVDRLLAADLTAATVEPWLQAWSDLTAIMLEAATAVERAVAEDTADQEVEARFLHLIEDIVPKSSIAEQALRAELLAVADYVPTEQTAALLRRFEAKTATFRPANVPLETELSRLSNRYDKIVGAMDVAWEGTTETLPQAQAHLLETDRNIREKAWRLIMARWQQDRAALNELYLEMLPIRRQIARNAGMANFRDYQWQQNFRFDYSAEDCFTFHDAIEHEVVPVARQLYEELASSLHVSSLKPWDSEVDPYGAPLKPFERAADLEEGAQRMFEAVDPVLAGHFATMRDGWLDLATRPNKAPGGFCSGFPVSRRPYIFMSAVGTNEDVKTILHEGGHAFHFMESASQPLVWNTNGPMEFCEVASLSMELLATPYLARNCGGFYDEAEARRAYADELRGIVKFLPYMAVVDAFQHWVYTKAPENASASEFDACWSSLWDRFMPGIDWSGLQDEKESGWQRKLHIFQIPFYYVEYGLAQLGALQVWRNALRDQAQAVANYRAALALGYTRSLPELFRAAGAEFAFDRRTLGNLMALVTEQLARLQA